MTSGECRSQALFAIGFFLRGNRMKEKYARVITGIICVLLVFGGCGSGAAGRVGSISWEAEASGTPDLEEADISGIVDHMGDEEVVDSLESPLERALDEKIWKEAYFEYFKNVKNREYLFDKDQGRGFTDCEFSFIYLDGDSIPEIICSDRELIRDTYIVSCQSGNVINMDMMWCLARYVPKSGIIDIIGGMDGVEKHHFFKLDGQNWVDLSGECMIWTWDNSTGEIYGSEEENLCIWGEEEFRGEEEFYRRVKEIGYDVTLERTPAYEMSYDELMAELGGL